MARSQEARVLLSCIAFALLVLTVLAANVARLGTAIAREVNRAQLDYMQDVGFGAPVESNALLLGQCLRREMLKLARAGFVHPDTWAVAARVHALPVCANALPALPSPVTPTARSRARSVSIGAPTAMHAAIATVPSALNGQ